MGINVNLRGEGDMKTSVYDSDKDGVIALAQLDALINKLSSITIDADLAMGAHDITLGAGQTVDSKDVSDTFIEKVDNPVISSLGYYVLDGAGTVTILSAPIKADGYVNVHAWMYCSGTSQDLQTFDGATARGTTGAVNPATFTGYHVEHIQVTKSNTFYIKLVGVGAGYKRVRGIFVLNDDGAAGGV